MRMQREIRKGKEENEEKERKLKTSKSLASLIFASPKYSVPHVFTVFMLFLAPTYQQFRVYIVFKMMTLSNSIDFIS